MFEQNDLFSGEATGVRLPARGAGAVTSKLAAVEITANGSLGNQCRQVLQAVRLWPGHTTRELADRIKADRHMVAKRAADLLESGEVRQGVQRQCRLSGRKAFTWWATGG